MSALAAMAATAVAITGCGSTGSGGAVGATTGHITLVVQNGDGGEPGLLAGYRALNKVFEEQHPGVTIDFVTKNLADLVTTDKLQLSGNTVPDVTEINQGYGAGDMGPLVADHLLLNLDGYAKKYNWTSRQSPRLLALDGRFSSNGTTFGSGPLYGIAATGAWVGLWVNTRLAHSLGIGSPPTTMAALNHDLAVAKAHGDIPMQYNAADCSWYFGSLLMPLDPQLILDSVFETPGTTFENQQTHTAAETILTWGTRGYFPPGWTANRVTDNFNQFLGGHTLFAVDGSWNVPLPSTAPTADFAMVPFPSVGGPAAPDAIATGDAAWSIPAHSKHQALAAEYINFLTSVSSATTWISTGSVPATLPANLSAAISASHLTGVSKDALVGWQQILSKGTPVNYPDWATPTFIVTLGNEVTELGAGKITPSAFDAALQADYGAYVKSKQ